MKVTIRAMILASAISLFTIIAAHGQVRHVLTLNVNTDNITHQNTNQECFFMVQSPGMEPIRSGDDIENFTIEVSVGDTLIWNGVSSISSEIAVDIKKIKHDKGTNVFDKDELDGNQSVVGTAKRETLGKNYKYTISFNVSNNPGLFRIDPIIVVKP